MHMHIQTHTGSQMAIKILAQLLTQDATEKGDPVNGEHRVQLTKISLSCLRIHIHFCLTHFILPRFLRNVINSTLTEAMYKYKKQTLVPLYNH